MGKITDIAVQKGNKKRVSVFIDGSFFCGLDEFTALKSRLKIGDEVDEDELAAAQAESEYTTALDKALVYLSVRMRSEKETADYLKGKGYLPATVSRVKKRLKELSYLDDEKFARLYVEENKARYGTVRLKAELFKRGVKAEITEQILDETDRGGEGMALARKLFKNCGDKYKLKERLARKGFTWSEIGEIISALEEEDFFGGDE